MKSYFDLLPDKLVHRIFSDDLYLTNREAIKLSLLSKRFFKLLHNLPVLILSCPSAMVKEDPYLGYKYIQELRYLCSTLKRYQDENIHLESLRFTFDTMFRRLTNSNIIDKCIELAAKTNITNLQITFSGYSNHYVLPKAVFGVESLVKLSLRNCRLEPAEEDVISWPNLRELCLHSVNLSSQTVFETVIKGCPLIETLDIHGHGFCMGKLGYNFKVSNLPNLKNLHVGLGLGNTVEVLASAAANLELIKCRSAPFSTDSSLNLGKHEYPKLKTLDLSCTEVDGNLSTDFASKFPRLECLEIRPSSGMSGMNLSSTALKEISMLVDYKDSLEEACFDVPNIVGFKYYRDCRGKAQVIVYKRKMYCSNQTGGMPYTRLLPSETETVLCSTKHSF